MKKTEIEVGQVLALVSRGYDRENYRGQRVEVVEVGASEPRRRYPYGVTSGSRVRYLDDPKQREVVVENRELWQPWDTFQAEKRVHFAEKRAAQQRKDEARAQVEAEKAEINAGLVGLGLEPITYGWRDGYDPERRALLAVIRKVEAQS